MFLHERPLAGGAHDEILAMSVCHTSFSGDEQKRIKPLAVTVKTACQLVGVGNTTMWALIKAGRVKTVCIGRRRLVIYASLEALVSDAGVAV